MNGRRVVACLCADWCDTCRAYRVDFEQLAARYPQAEFVWIDIEDDAELAGEIEVEDFPTVLVAQAGAVLFAGPLRPDRSHLARLLDALDGAAATTVDPAWQGLAARLTA